MFEKANRFYADWRTRKGQRKRKSFTSANAALRHEEEQKALAHPKQKAQGRSSEHSLRRSSGRPKKASKRITRERQRRSPKSAQVSG